MGQIKFCSPWKIGFLSVFPAQPAATKRSRQCGNEAHSGHGFWLAGNRLAFPFRPETFRPNRKIRLPDCTRAVNKRRSGKGAEGIASRYQLAGAKSCTPLPDRSKKVSFARGNFPLRDVFYDRPSWLARLQLANNRGTMYDRENVRLLFASVFLIRE